MAAGLTKCGPTLLLIKDTKGHVFGGFASHAWEVKPQFQGERRESRLILLYYTLHGSDVNHYLMNTIFIKHQYQLLLTI